jgi:aspartate kinase
MMYKRIVLKFGGASLKDISHFENVAQIIESTSKNYNHVCVVVSAMEGMTDYLDFLVNQVDTDASKREKDMLLSVGERMSMALLAMILLKRGVAAVSLTGSQVGIITTTEHTNAKIIDVKTQKLESLFKEGKIPIIAGFQGISVDKEITTLGRGGSDTTAVAIAIAIGAEKVVFYKDVEGIYSKNPKSNSDAKVLTVLSHKEALAVVGEGKSAVLHPRCVEMAYKNGLTLQVRSFDVKLKDKIGSMIISAEMDSKGKERLFEYMG